MPEHDVYTKWACQYLNILYVVLIIADVNMVILSDQKQGGGWGWENETLRRKTSWFTSTIYGPLSFG